MIVNTNTLTAFYFPSYYYSPSSKPELLLKSCYNILQEYCRGRQSKVWSRLVDDLFASLKLDKADSMMQTDH